MIKKVGVPKERIGVLIGKNGETRREIEAITKTHIEVNDEVTIEGDLGVLDAENVVKAIARGFTPEQAMQLMEEDKTLCVIQLPKNKESLSRIRARIIGKGGKCRKNIERLTGSGIVVYGRTVSIIGTYENAEYAREAIERLIRGSKHSNVFRYLEDLHARGKIH